MITHLHFLNHNSKKSKLLVNSHWRKKLLSSLMAVSITLLSITNSKAQTSQTMPLDHNIASGTFTYFNTTARIFQLLIDDSQLTALSGKQLNSISLRLPINGTTSWPATNATFTGFEIYLSDSVEPANRVLNFAGNILGNQTQVRSGSLVIPAGALVAGNSANPFSFNINFTTPYLYNGGNLLIEIRHTGVTGASSSTAGAALTSTVGYGSLFSACWATSATVNASQGNFLAIKINATDNLGVKSVELGGETVVYPNPVKDILNVKSESNISEISVFNTSGQKILTQKTDTKNPQISVSDFTKGVYFLQTIDKNGNMKSTKFIKD